MNIALTWTWPNSFPICKSRIFSPSSRSTPVGPDFHLRGPQGCCQESPESAAGPGLSGSSPPLGFRLGGVGRPQGQCVPQYLERRGTALVSVR